MTDTRLPDRWLMNPIMRELTDTDWRVFTWGLMQSNNQQTDGHIPASALVLLHPDGKQPESYKRLCAVGLWVQVVDGYQVIEWAETQTLSADLQRKRIGNRERQKNKRNRDSAQSVIHDVSITRDVTRDVQGEDRQGEDRKGEERQGQVVSTGDTYDPLTGELTGWNAVSIPTKGDLEDDTF